MKLQIQFAQPARLPTAVVVKDEIPGGWRVKAEMTIQGGRAVIANLSLTPIGKRTPPGGITQAVVRRVRYGSFGPFLLTRLRELETHPIVGQTWKKLTAAILPRVGTVMPARPRRRRDMGRDDYFYAVLARDYLDVIARGSRSPIKDLAGTRRVSISRMRDMVREARERGLLSLSQAGIRGGVLLPRAVALLPSRKTP